MGKKLFFLTLLLFLFSAPLTLAHAQEVSPSAMPTPTPVDYQLPYPGILPGNPFYFLKVGRDKVMSFLISSPLKKAEFDLLQADKRLQASVVLLANGNQTVALSTLGKGENYFEEAITKISEAKKQGMDIHDITKRLEVSNLKHQEVVVQMEQRATGDAKKQLANELQRIKELGKKIKN